MMDWTHVLGIVLGNAAFVIPMFLWNRSESRADYRHMEACTNANFKALREESQIILRSIQQEMKDFHGRLERQDAEFKGRLEKQDAEFKAHLIHCHQMERK